LKSVERFQFWLESTKSYDKECRLLGCGAVKTSNPTKVTIVHLMGASETSFQRWKNQFSERGNTKSLLMHLRLSRIGLLLLIALRCSG
jgi:hypothetical protein